jgi:hypothetical protein
MTDSKDKRNIEFINEDNNLNRKDSAIPIDYNLSDDALPWYDAPDDGITWDNATVDDFSLPTDGQNSIKHARESYKRVDNQIIDFITNFVVNQNSTIKQKLFLKNIFFWIIMGIFIIVTATPILVVILVNSNNTLAFISSILAAITQTLASIIILPKIVAEYLFNKEEDVATLKIVELMHAYSETVHGYDKEK